ncbi:unnamed protein product [Eruca vesicaria subsp. sativa]|uniref:Uncharacterized protein n=1 Tax=Eruca vesicaria subsp. sativa TaxID=29727 RepID=A0ABC8L097_ERUVS|nr:unnamed protein product [Eruca vesicaria subsp. sativa]
MMNPMFCFLLTLTAVLAMTEGRGSTPVLDSDSKNVLSNESYSIIPLKSNGVSYDSGGLTVFNRGGTCPIYIGVKASEFNLGVTVRFSDWNSTDKYVPQLLNLNIKMNITTPIKCLRPKYWAAGAREEAWFLRAGIKPLKPKFQIKKSDVYMGGYYISYCPAGFNCTRVGTFVNEDGVRHLALNATPAHFAFVRGVIKTSSKTTMSIG